MFNPLKKPNFRRWFMLLVVGLLGAAGFVSTTHADLKKDDWLKQLMSGDISALETAQDAVRSPDTALQSSRAMALLHFLQTLDATAATSKNQRRVGYETLGIIGPPAQMAAPWLLDQFKKTSDPVEAASIMDSLAKISATPEMVSSLIETLKHPNERVALDAAEALGRLDAPSPLAIKALLPKLATCKDWVDRMTVARALSQLKPWDAADAKILDTDLKAPDVSLAYAAAWLWQQVFPSKPLNTANLYSAIPHTMADVTLHPSDQPAFEVVLKSFSGDFTEDDTSLWILQPGHDPIFAGFEGQLAQFNFLPRVQGEPLLGEVRAFNGQDGNIIIPMLSDDRPFGKQMAGVLYNPKRHALLASAARLGEVPSDVEIVPLPDGFSFKEVLQPSDSVACGPNQPDGCGTWHGQKILSYTDEWIHVWWDVVCRAEHPGWSKHLNLARTWESNRARVPFKTPEAFAKAFGLDTQHDDVQTYWFQNVFLENHEQWFCVAPARLRSNDPALAWKLVDAPKNASPTHP